MPAEIDVEKLDVLIVPLEIIQSVKRELVLLENQIDISENTLTEETKSLNQAIDHECNTIKNDTPYIKSNETSSTSNTLSKEEKVVINKFRKIGFESAEILNTIEIMRTQSNPLDEDAIYLTLLQSLRQVSIPIQSDSIDKLENNSILQDEIAVLQSIYEDLVCIRKVQLFGTCCIALDLAVENSCNIRIFIQNASYYPTSNAILLCWYSCNENENDKNAIIRSVCDESDAYANSLLNHDTPVLFDYVHYIQSTFIDRVEIWNKNRVDNAKIVVDNHPEQKSTDIVDDADTVTDSFDNDAIKSASARVNKVDRKYTNIKEYRIALNQALVDGLEGQAARDAAKVALQLILPASIIEEIRKEEDLIESIRASSYSIYNLGTRGEIEVSKMLQSNLGVKKVKAKALFHLSVSSLTKVKHVTVSYDEKSMKQIVYDEALLIHMEKLQRDEEKEEAKRKVKRGLTIREAYQQMRSRNNTSHTAVTETFEDDAVDETVESYELENVDDSFIDEYEEVEATVQTEGGISAEGCQMKEDLEKLRLNGKYKKLLAQRCNLPVYRHAQQIVTSVKRNRVTLIYSSTGSGKTTQIPQLILDNAIDEGLGDKTNIIVTQPRRISAISVAERIATERVDKLGNTVGYKIRLEAQKSKNTKILLMTTGVLLRMLQSDDALSTVSHIVVDEIHERGLDTDFLLVLIKQLLKVKPTLRVILMSATLNAQLFADYFASEKCSVISVPGRSFPITSYYLEDILQQTNFKIESTSDCVYNASKISNIAMVAKEPLDRGTRWRRITDSLSHRYPVNVLKSLEIVDESILNIDLIKQLLLHIMSSSSDGAVLIFVAGIEHIRLLISFLSSDNVIDSGCILLPLHSSLSNHDQSKVFQLYKSTGKRKVIISTNIAETSITIEDVKFVIDTLRVKEQSYDPSLHLNILYETYISSSNARQRMGRTARVSAGTYYSMVSSVTFQSLNEYTVPEILRLSLDSLVLSILALDLGDPKTFLADALDPPENSRIENSLSYLHSLGAVTLNSSTGHASLTGEGFNLAGGGCNSELTPLGFHLSALPVAPNIGKLILCGYFMKVLDPILTIAAIMSSGKSPFLSPFDESERQKADQARLRFCKGDSDLITLVNAYDTWENVKSNIYDFCRVNYINNSAMELIKELRESFVNMIKDVGFLDVDINISNLVASTANIFGEDLLILKSVLTTLSPNILTIPKAAISTTIPTISLSKKLSDINLISNKRGMSFNLSPASVLSNVKVVESKYLCFTEGSKSSNAAGKSFIRDATVINPLAMTLFCSKLQEFQDNVLCLDSWIYLKCEPDLIEIIVKIRQILEDNFVKKIVDPHCDVENIVNCVLQILLTLLPSVSIL